MPDDKPLWAGAICKDWSNLDITSADHILNSLLSYVSPKKVLDIAKSYVISAIKCWLNVFSVAEG